MKENEIDEVVAARFRNGDINAFNLVYNENYRKYVYLARMKIEDREAAISIVNDAFIKLWRERNKYVLTKALLYTIVMNACRDYLEKKNRAAGKHAEFLAQREPNAIQEEENKNGEAELFARIYDAMDELPKKMRASIQLNLQEEASLEETALRMGCTTKTVLNQRKKGIDRIRKALNKPFLRSLFFFL